MDLILTNIGLQPAAVAVTLASWLAHRGPSAGGDRLVLLHTRETAAIAERLRAWADSAPTLASVDAMPVAPGAVDATDAPAAGTLVGQFRALHPGHRVVFFGDPGLNTQVVSAQRGLDPPYLRLHSSDRELLIAETPDRGAPRWTQAPLIDLGLPTLLGLAERPVISEDLTAEGIAALPTQLAQALNATPAPHNLRQISTQTLGLLHTTAILGYERRGRLYLLVWLPVPDRAVKAIDIANEVGHLRQSLHPIKPWMTVLCADPMVREHVTREYLIPAMHPNCREGVAKWLGRSPLSPGRVPGTPHTPGYDLITDYVAEPAVEGVQDLTLGVCLGADPSVTLLSICTHRPRRLILFYDQDNNRVRALACVLRRLMPELPVAEARFLAIDRLGTDIVTLHREASRHQQGPVILDITPGTKSQACEMARVADADLWTIQGNEGLAKHLDTDARVPLNGPPLLTWTHIAHGPLTAERPPRCLDAQDRARTPFLKALHRNLRGPLRDAPAPVDLKSLLDELHNDRGSPIRLRRNWSAENWTLWINWPQQHSDTFDDFGALFEDLVSQALLRLAPDELCQNIAWSWSSQMEKGIRDRMQRKGLDPTQPHRRELDIALRFGHRVVAVSCKSSAEAHRPTPDAMHEIEALAETAFGRFTLPVLVRTRFPQEMKDASLARGAVLLDLVDLADPAGVRRTLMGAFAKRSTVNHDP